MNPTECARVISVPVLACKDKGVSASGEQLPREAAVAARELIAGEVAKQKNHDQEAYDQGPGLLEVSEQAGSITSN